jgi:hypothetical protein
MFSVIAAFVVEGEGERERKKDGIEGGRGGCGVVGQSDQVATIVRIVRELR